MDLIAECVMVESSHNKRPFLRVIDILTEINCFSAGGDTWNVRTFFSTARDADGGKWVDSAGRVIIFNYVTQDSNQLPL